MEATMDPFQQINELEEKVLVEEYKAKIIDLKRTTWESCTQSMFYITQQIRDDRL
jgi:hypothetical protein